MESILRKDCSGQRLIQWLWRQLKRFLEAVEGKCLEKKSWWWNKELQSAVKEKRGA